MVAGALVIAARQVRQARAIVSCAFQDVGMAMEDRLAWRPGGLRMPRRHCTLRYDPVLHVGCKGGGTWASIDATDGAR